MRLFNYSNEVYSARVRLDQAEVQIVSSPNDETAKQLFHEALTYYKFVLANPDGLKHS